ncbi:MAG: hypothetical protein ABI693_01000 [Bryobacteraceae bacterium]
MRVILGLVNDPPRGLNLRILRIQPARLAQLHNAALYITGAAVDQTQVLVQRGAGTAFAAHINRFLQLGDGRCPIVGGG